LFATPDLLATPGRRAMSGPGAAQGGGPGAPSRPNRGEHALS
jgi:hypothetical protein